MYLVVIKGKIEEIKFKKKDNKPNSLGEESEIFMAFPFLKDKNLNMRPLEQGLDQLNRLSSNEAKLLLEPGEELGKTKVVIENEKQKFIQFQFSLNNQGSKDLGYIMTSYGLELHSLFFLNELININLQKNLIENLKGDYNRSTSFRFTLPFGPLTFSFLSSVNLSKNTINGTYLNFLNTGTTRNQDVGLEFVIFRDTISKSNLNINHKIRQSSNYISGELLQTSSRSTKTYNITLNQSVSFLNTNLNFTLTHIRGILSEIENEVLNLLNDVYKLDFNKSTLNIVLRKPFAVNNQRMQWVSTLDAQVSDHNLYSSELWISGGISNVRGFKNQSLSGDRGISLRNELSWTIPGFSHLGENFFESNSLFIGYDFASVTPNNLNNNRGQIEGIAFGINSNNKNTSFSLTLSKSIRTTENLKEESSLWLQLSFNF